MAAERRPLSQSEGNNMRQTTVVQLDECRTYSAIRGFLFRSLTAKRTIERSKTRSFLAAGSLSGGQRGTLLHAAKSNRSGFRVLRREGEKESSLPPNLHPKSPKSQRTNFPNSPNFQDCLNLRLPRFPIAKTRSDKCLRGSIRPAMRSAAGSFRPQKGNRPRFRRCGRLRARG